MNNETIDVLYDILKDVYENYYKVAKERDCDDILNGVIDDIADRSFKSFMGEICKTLKEEMI